MGSYTQTVAPTLWPISLDEAKALCSVAGSQDNDGLIGYLIGVATDAVERRLARQIMTSTWTLKFDGFPDEIIIDKPPVTEIVSIYYKDTAGATKLLAPANYQTRYAINNDPACITTAYGYSWPNTYPGSYDTVTVTFKSGYSSAGLVPPTIKHAVGFLVAHWFRNREPVTMNAQVDILPEALEMLFGLADWGMYS
jgi:uncharacterized phiE125 gp8 family phage protein